MMSFSAVPTIKQNPGCVLAVSALSKPDVGIEDVCFENTEDGQAEVTLSPLSSGT